MSKGNKLLTGGIALLILGQFSITMSFFAITYPLKEFPQLLSIINIARAMNTTVGCVEIIIGGVIVYLLHTSRSGFKRTNTAINRLIFYTVASGLLTGLDAIIGSILSFALPQTEYYLLFCGIGAKRLSISIISQMHSSKVITIPPVPTTLVIPPRLITVVPRYYLPMVSMVIPFPCLLPMLIKLAGCSGTAAARVHPQCGR